MAILKLTDICKDYQQGKEPVRVLKNINLTVEREIIWRSWAPPVRERPH